VIGVRLALLDSTVIGVAVVSPTGAARTQLYRFVSTRLGVLGRRVAK